MPRWNRGKDKADTAAPAPFAVPEPVIDSGQHYREAAELARTGSRGRATITSVTFGGKLYDGVVWTIGMRVQPDDGDAFDAELALALDAEFQDGPPERSARPPRSCSTPATVPGCGSCPRTLPATAIRPLSAGPLTSRDRRVLPSALPGRSSRGSAWPVTPGRPGPR